MALAASLFLNLSALGSHSSFPGIFIANVTYQAYSAGPVSNLYRTNWLRPADYESSQSP
jgi:hypothetical protein